MKISVVCLITVIALILVACGGEEPTATPPLIQPAVDVEELAMPIAADQMVNRVWQWTGLVETAPAAQSVVPNPENYTLLFNSDGTVNLQADCNMVRGSYSFTEGALTISLGPSTMAYCGEASLDTQYLELLSRVVSTGLEDGRLILYLQEDAGHMSFADGGPPPESAPGGGLSPEALQNGTYSIPDLGEVQLVDGAYENKYGEGATMVDKVGLDSWALGDLNGDGQEDGVVVLWWDSGGSGVFEYLAAMLDDNGTPRQAAIQFVEDRAQTLSLLISSRQITLEAITHGPDDPMCCPTQQVVDTYELQGDQLVQISSEAVGTVAAPGGGGGLAPRSSVAGTVWVWESYQDFAGENDINVPDPSAYRLELRPDGLYHARADCNQVTGAYTLEGSSLTLEPGITTLAECGPESLYSVYLQRLEAAATYVLEDDTLYLNLMADAGNMIFRPLNAVTGRLVGPVGAALPENAQVEVKILDSGGNQIGGQLLADQAQFPIAYEAAFDPDAVQPAGDYLLDVTISDGAGDLAFRHARLYPVLTQERPTYHIDVLVVPAAAAEGLELDESHIRLDTGDLPYSWQPNLVPEQPYAEGQLPAGLPEHLQINFGMADLADKKPGDPVMYILPADAYRQLWEAAGNPSVSIAMAGVYRHTVALPYPPPISGVLALPHEEVAAVNDLAVQLGRAGEEGTGASNNGYRFVGRWAQGPNPVTNQDLRYVYQGFTNDSRYVVASFYPVASPELPADVSEIPQDKMDQFNSDPQTYIHEQAGMLNGLEPAQWEPDLATLDALVGSLEIVGMPPHGIQDQVWALVARSEGGRDEALPTGKAEYTVVFGSDGTLAFTADCNQGAAAYDVTGGMVGGLATYPGPMTLAQCAPESLSDLLVNALAAAQDYRIWPGGHVLELVLPAGGGSLLFSNLGPADAHGPDDPDEPSELPTPAPQMPYGRVVAPQGVNLRTGPGTMYPVVGFVPVGTEGEIIGRSADRLWWVARAPQAPNGQVWVSVAHVEVFNVQNVPVIPAPPQPIPTSTPEPEVTATPGPEINFWADQTVIDPDACTTLRWKVENVQTVYVYPQGEPYDKYPVTGEGTRQECPATTTSYELRAQRRDGAVELRQVTIQVKAQNSLANTNWRLTALYVTQVPLPEPAITLSFDAAGQLRGDAGCNSYNAAYAVQGNVISIGPLVTTGKLCDERVNAQEGSYLNALPAVGNFEIQGNQLVLRSAGGQELLRYVRQ